MTIDSVSAIIALVDDDPFDTAYLQDVLAAAVPEAEVRSFGSLSDALHALAGFAVGTSKRLVLLVDAALLLNELDDAAEPLRRLRALSAVCVVALVSSGHSAAVEPVLAAGADDVLCRPADPAQLAFLVNGFVVTPNPAAA